MTETPGWQTALEMLSPLEVILYAAEARGDRRVALQYAYEGAAEAVRVLAAEAPHEESLTAVHGVWVALTALPLVAQGDGTLVESGTHVSLEYRRYQVTDDEVAAITVELADKLGVMRESDCLPESG